MKTIIVLLALVFASCSKPAETVQDGGKVNAGTLATDVTVSPISYQPKWTDHDCFFHYDTDAPYPLVLNPKCKTVEDRISVLENRIHELEGLRPDSGVFAMGVDPEKAAQILQIDRFGALRVTVVPEGGLPVTIKTPTPEAPTTGMFVTLTHPLGSIKASELTDRDYRIIANQDPDGRPDPKP